MKSKRFRLIIQLVGLLLGLGTFFLAIRSVRLQALGTALGANLNGFLALSILAWIVSILFQVWRWQIMLNARNPVPFNAALKLYVLSRLTNLLFLFRVGEGVRVVAASRQFQINTPFLIASIVNERLLNAFFLALITLGLTFTLPYLASYRAWIFGGLCLTITIWFLFGKKKMTTPSINETANSKTSRFQSFLRKFLTGISILREPAIMRGVLLTSLCSWGCLWFGIWSLLQNVQPDNSWLSALTVLLLINVTGILPLTPSSVGPFQWACIFALSYFGADQTAAVAFSLILQGVRVLAALLAGVCAMAFGFIQSKLAFDLAGEKLAET